MQPLTEQTDTPVVVTEDVNAEELKKQGNECFALKKYDEAISFYDQAISIDAENAVLFSNRSACYAAKKLWKKAMEDGLESVSKDPSFIKGYYRLSTAQVELGLFDEALVTLKAALAREPKNDQIIKQISAVQARKSGINNAVLSKPKKVMNEAQKREAYELQEQTNVYVRDLKQVQSRISASEREARTAKITLSHVAGLEPAIPLYRSVGKAFFLTGREELEKGLENQAVALTRSQRELLDRQEYLERRITSNTTNLKDLMAEYSMQ